MNRRRFLTAALTAGGSAALALKHWAGAQVSPDYAESVALSGITLDGSRELSLRLGRFPGRRTATLWAGAFLGDASWAAAVGGLELGERPGPTPVRADRAVFEVRGEAVARCERWGLEDGAFAGEAFASLGAHPSHHPPPGAGDQPLRIDAAFEAWHEPVYPSAGRLEMLGNVSATVHTPAGVERIAGVGGWHEQVGERPRFAPAFTYFKAMGVDGGRRIGVLATLLHSSGDAWGFALLDGGVARVTGLDIDGEQERRAFRIRLDGGRTIEGSALRLREHSVPVEGRRRPGTTVRVTTNVGALVGHLNDWHPKPE